MTNKLKALYIAKDIPIAKIRSVLPYTEISTTKEKAVYRLDGAFLYIYSFGSIVLMDFTASEEKEVRKLLAKAGINLKSTPCTDDYEVVEDKSEKTFAVDSNKVVVKDVTPSVLKVVARVLAQSVALESYEDEFEKIDDDFCALNDELQKHGSLRRPGKDIMRMIASNNTVFDEIVSGIGVLDKPDSAWESAFIDSLHTKLSDEFELVERFQNLNSKMDFIQENYKVFLESLRNNNDVRLEWIVIILIAMEIVLFLYELFA
ncbi:MAG: RMD1 family protein [Candidatus Woesearchaeota archaeon]